MSVATDIELALVEAVQESAPCEAGNVHPSWECGAPAEYVLHWKPVCDNGGVVTEDDGEVDMICGVHLLRLINAAAYGCHLCEDVITDIYHVLDSAERI